MIALPKQIKYNACIAYIAVFSLKTHSYAGVAQLVEQLICNQPVVSSNLIASSNKIKHLQVGLFFCFSRCYAGATHFARFTSFI